MSYDGRRLPIREFARLKGDNEYSYAELWSRGLAGGVSLAIAYFVMEIGLESDMPTYAGGLGVLAGDTAYTFADLSVPATFVTLLYKAGYTKQKLGPGGQQQDLDSYWQYKERLWP